MNEEREVLLLHCNDCANELPDDICRVEFDRLSVARVEKGILIWCNRHEKEIVTFPYIWTDEVKCSCCGVKGCKC